MRDGSKSKKLDIIRGRLRFLIDVRWSMVGLRGSKVYEKRSLLIQKAS